MSFSLKQLRYAVALTETGHFGRAAERSHISQPALSQQIQALEALCGAALFDRMGKTVRTTPFGAEFVERARRTLAEADDLLALAEGHTGTPARPLRFGLIPTVAPYLLPEVFPALRTALPVIRFEASESRTDALLLSLGSGDLDLAVIATEPPAGSPPLTLIRLFDDPFVLAAGHGDPLPASLSLEAVPIERLLLLEEGHCLRDQAIAACGLDGALATRTFAATSLSTIVAFVAEGQGMTLLPSIALRREAADGRIAVRRLAPPGAGRTLSLAFRTGSPFRDLFSRIAEVITEAHRQRELDAPRSGDANSD